TNNFPDFTGRVCPAPCEGSCVLGINNPPVTIKNIECAIIEHGWEHGWVVPEPPKVRTGKKVAVVGSGPDGLCAAAQLNKARHVVFSGGGDAGTDCVATPMRHGWNSLVLIEILPKPPMERAKDNPWPEWPKVYKLDYGQEEAAAKFGGHPRVYLTTAKKFIGEANGHVKAVHTVQVQWERNDKGQFIPKHVPGTEKVLPEQLVL